jgi:hypothetical protein
MSLAARATDLSYRTRSCFEEEILTMANHEAKPPSAALTVERLEDRLVPNATTFVTSIYHNLLDRAPDAAGLNFWVQRIANGESNQDLATEIWRSQEHRIDEVDSYYQTFLQRPADPSGQALWVSMLTTGQLDELGVELSFVTSPEYVNTHNTPAAYVTGLYLGFLGRTPAIGDQAFWQQALASQGAITVASDIATATESYTKVLDYYYQTYLNRAPDQTGLSTWLTQLQTSQGTLESVAESILGSQEYANLH